MLQAQDSFIAKILKQRIQEITPVEQMIVFGSRVRGDAIEESDLDVFIELPVLTPALRQQIFEIAWEISLDRGVVISTLVASGPNPLNGQPIRLAIEREGVVV